MPLTYIVGRIVWVFLLWTVTVAPLTLWRKSRGVSFTAAAPPTLSVIVPKWVQQVLFK